MIDTSKLPVESDFTPEMDMVTLLETAFQSGVSDVLLTANTPPMFKIHGRVIPYAAEELSPHTIRDLVYQIMNDQQKKQFETEHELDFSAPTPSCRFRVNLAIQRGSIMAVMRTIPTDIRPFHELGLPPVMAQVASKKRGLILVTGPTGSGKSTTLAAMIDHINDTRPCHIVTIEDPIEFFHYNKKAVINQREVGNDTHSFAKALKSILRQAPDVILVGEMRDRETIEAALTAAETGHLVMGTLHTNGAPETVSRIIDVFEEGKHSQVRSQLASNLVCVMSQQLVPTVNNRGRTMTYEIMVATNAIKSMIREGKTQHLANAIQTGSAEGMVSMDVMLSKLYRDGKITYEDGLERAVDPKEYARRSGKDEK